MNKPHKVEPGDRVTIERSSTVGGKFDYRWTDTVVRVTKSGLIS